MKNAGTNTQRIEYTQICKTIGKKIEEGTNIHNERLIEAAIENINSYMKAKKKN